MTTTITISEVDIHQDENGRYSLNDLHEAVVLDGFNKRTKEPAKFFATPGVKELVEFLLEESVTQNLGNTSPINTVSSGKYEDRGTFVVKELVYAYAMWVSPKFHLHVIRVFDAVMTGDYIEPKLQAEKAWFARRPLWAEIRRRALLGEPNALIAAELDKSPASVWNAIKRMMEFGLINPAKILRFKYGSARQTVLSFMPGYVAPDYEQLPLQLEVGAV